MWHGVVIVTSLWLCKHLVARWCTGPNPDTIYYCSYVATYIISLRHLIVHESGTYCTFCIK